MIDLHCHIIPGVDDGPSSLAESVEMAEMAAADGVSVIAATPHAFNGVYGNPRPKIRAYFKRLKEVFENRKIKVALVSGAEVHFCSGLSRKIESGQIQTINNNRRHFLLELPPQTIPPSCKDEIFDLCLNNYTPIIAHPERNSTFHFDLKLLYDFIEMGCLVQVTAASITGALGKAPRDLAHKMLKLRLAHIIASDSHSPTNRPPVLTPAVRAAAKIMGNAGEALKLVRDNPLAVLKGATVDVAKPMRTRRKKKFPFLAMRF